MIERFQFAAKAERDAYVADQQLAAWLANRRAYELANMSRHIRPEHHAQCLTQRAVALFGDLECDAPTFDAALDRKPPTATRIRVVIADDGNETKTPIVADARDIADVIEDVKVRK